MNEVERKQAATVTRDELYRQVWETPMSRLASRYGISGNGLKKICNRLNVPHPAPGYWAKVGAGKAVRSVPLPVPTPGVPTNALITPTPTPPAEAASRATQIVPGLAQALQSAMTAASDIAVPAALRRPHWAVAAWIKSHERELLDAKRHRLAWGTSFGPKPFTPLERRQQRIFSTLLLAGEKLGYQFEGELPHNASLLSGKNVVEFVLRERIKQVRRLLTNEEKSSSGRRQKWTQERVPTGHLVFSIKTYLAPGLQTEWCDGDQRLEERITEIVAVLAVAPSILEKRRLEQAEAERCRREEERRRSEERDRVAQERNRWRRLVQYAELSKQAQIVGELISALETQSLPSDARYGDKSADEWVAWARQLRDTFDPSNWNLAALWTDIASIRAWDSGRSIDDLY